MYKQFYLFILFCTCSVLILYGCQKTNNNPDFSYNGTLAIGSPITFKCSFADSPNVFWILGDGTFSNQNSPTNTYNTIGLYLVSLIANNDSLHPITKILNIVSGSYRVAGNWRWKSGYTWRNGNTAKTQVIDDTTFHITLINDTTINIGGQNLSGIGLNFSYYKDAYNYIQIQGFNLSGYSLSFTHVYGDSLNSIGIQYFGLK